MAKKVVSKKTAVKKDVPTTEKKPAEKPVTHKRTGAASTMVQMLLERKHTDVEIATRVRELHPEFCSTPKSQHARLSTSEAMIRNCIGGKRSVLNQGIKAIGGEALVPLYRDASGNLTTERPHKERAAAKSKYTSDTDPLNTVAGIDVHTEPEAKPEVKAKKAPRKAKAKAKAKA